MVKLGDININKNFRNANNLKSFLKCKYVYIYKLIY